MSVFQKKITLNIGGRLMDLRVPKVMGIINLTPDSFYLPETTIQGNLSATHTVLKQAGQMLSEGADFLDMGAYSSRPGAEHISAKEELDRLLPSLQAIRKEFPEAIISVDTFRADIARTAVSEGANMINDISGGELDTEMFNTVSQLGVPYILMHMKGNPQTMKQQASYTNLFDEIADSFFKKNSIAQ